MATAVSGRVTRPRLGRRIAGGLLFHATTLQGLSDTGDPIEVANDARVELPDESNACTCSIHAHALFSRDEPKAMPLTFGDRANVKLALARDEQPRAAFIGPYLKALPEVSARNSDVPKESESSR